MQEKTTPAGTGVISNDVSIRSIRSRHNHTTKNSLGKHFKQPPFADQIFKRSRLWHIYIGEDSITRCASDYEKYGFWHRIAAMALPWNADPFDFAWPVQGKTLDILSTGKHSELVRELGNALQHCGAAHVFGRANGEVMEWHNTARVAA